LLGQVIWIVKLGALKISTTYVFSPLKRQEFGCNWSVRKVLKAKKYGLPPEKVRKCFS